MGGNVGSRGSRAGGAAKVFLGSGIMSIALEVPVLRGVTD